MAVATALVAAWAALRKAWENNPSVTGFVLEEAAAVVGRGARGAVWTAGEREGARGEKRAKVSTKVLEAVGEMAGGGDKGREGVEGLEGPGERGLERLTGARLDMAPSCLLGEGLGRRRFWEGGKGEGRWRRRQRGAGRVLSRALQHRWPRI